MSIHPELIAIDFRESPWSSSGVDTEERTNLSNRMQRLIERIMNFALHEVSRRARVFVTAKGFVTFPIDDAHCFSFQMCDSRFQIHCSEEALRSVQRAIGRNQKALLEVLAFLAEDNLQCARYGFSFGGLSRDEEVDCAFVAMVFETPVDKVPMTLALSKECFLRLKVHAECSRPEPIPFDALKVAEAHVLIPTEIECASLNVGDRWLVTPTFQGGGYSANVVLYAKRKQSVSKYRNLVRERIEQVAFPKAVSGSLTFFQEKAEFKVSNLHGGNMKHATLSLDQRQFISELQLEVNVELGRFAISVANLIDLSVGQQLQLSYQPGEPVLLSVGGEVVGRGRLLTNGEQLIVEICEVGDGESEKNLDQEETFLSEARYSLRSSSCPHIGELRDEQLDILGVQNGNGFGDI